MSEYEPRPTDRIKVQGGKEYLPVANRVQWFRGEHPAWTIATSVVELAWAEGYAVIRAEVIDDTGRLIASGMKTETRKGFGDFVEKAETGAVGRALARAGYGTEDALDLEGDRYADAPIEQPEPSARGERSGARQAQAGSVPSAPARTPEEQALLDDLLALPGMTYTRMHLLADAVNIPKGQHASADQLREMIRIAQQPLYQPEPVSRGAAPASTPDAGQPSGQEAAGSSVPAASDSDAEGGAVPTSSATSEAGDRPPVAAPPAAPTLDDVLAVTGGELIPPEPGTPEYKALPAPERASAKAYWQKAGA